MLDHRRKVHAREILRFFRHCLQEGGTLEIDGLGILEQNADGSLVLTPFAKPKVFLAYVEEDLPHARRIFEKLKQRGCDPWLDKEKLLPGQNWPRRIEAAISVADYFVALFSRRSVSKRGQFQAELRYALDCVKRQPLDHAFFIPIRLEDCRLPAAIADSIHYVDLFPDWNQGFERLWQTVTSRGSATSSPDACESLRHFWPAELAPDTLRKPSGLRPPPSASPAPRPSGEKPRRKSDPNV